MTDEQVYECPCGRKFITEFSRDLHKTWAHSGIVNIGRNLELSPDYKVESSFDEWERSRKPRCLGQEKADTMGTDNGVIQMSNRYTVAIVDAKPKILGRHTSKEHIDTVFMPAWAKSIQRIRCFTYLGSGLQYYPVRFYIESCDFRDIGVVTLITTPDEYTHTTHLMQSTNPVAINVFPQGRVDCYAQALSPSAFTVSPYVHVALEVSSEVVQ